MTNEQKKHVDAFEYWVKTNTENGVSTIPESICKDIIADLLKELQERRKADSCEGCKNIGLWENEYENGLSCPCLRCTRRAKDNYEPERRAND